MSSNSGPFSVDPDQIVRLVHLFTPFVNRLLSVEHAAAGQRGSDLQLNTWENVADGGVDATVACSVETDWIPEGESVWQFKRGDLTPEECRKELAGASLVQERLNAGAVYRLALGARLTARTMKNRREALIGEAKRLGLPSDESFFKVFDADAIARWTELHPSLAVSRMLGGPGNVAADYTFWSKSKRLGKPWVSTPELEQVLDAVRIAVLDPDQTDLRVSGVSGVGKTRAVMEAFRGQPYETLVAYVSNEADLRGEYLNHLLGRAGTSVVVVDGCSAKGHEKFAEVIPDGSCVTLISIGEPDPYSIRAPILRLSPLGESTLDEIVKSTVPALWPEARRVVAGAAAGNAQFAIWLAEEIIRDGTLTPASLITTATVKQFVTRALPDGQDFLGGAVLALFSRIGWDGEVGHELDLVADALSLQATDLRKAGARLQAEGLLAKQGRYRSVTPHPVAVLLASAAWQEFEAKIVHDLVPQLTESLALGFFRRVADIGDFEPTRNASEQLLGADGPFGTWAKISEGNNSGLLTQIAIAAPDATTRHLSTLIQSATSDELLDLKGIRRNLVWTLEKLAWHSRTFESAAEDLLLLALTENETWSNNSTGTWVEFFNTMLPGTSARPAARAAYLKAVSERVDVRARALAVKAAAHALKAHESIMVSGELQGGVIVEPRGTPATYGEAFDYQRSMIAVLRARLTDPDAEVAVAAVDGLIAAIHPLLESEPVRDDLAEALLAMDSTASRRVRTEIAHLGALFERVSGQPDLVAPDDPSSSVEGRRLALIALASRLPAIPASEELGVLSNARRWDFADGELQSRISTTLRAAANPDALDVAVDLLEEEVAAAYELGGALAAIYGRDAHVLVQLTRLSIMNLPALVGYLWGIYNAGDAAAFDDYLGSNLGDLLPIPMKVAIAVRGPVSEVGVDRVTSYVTGMSPREGAQAMFGWHRSLSTERATAMLADWVRRISDQDDYNAVVDFTMLMIHSQDDLKVALADEIRALVLKRRELPEVGREAWDWARLAEVVLPHEPLLIAQLLIGLMDDATLLIHDNSEEANLLRQCAEAHPAEVWAEIGSRIEDGAWRVQISVRGWLLYTVPVDVLDDWIGQDVDRARLVAAIAPAGGAEPSPIARLLLDRYGDDDRVASGLTGEFMSGGWMGSFSNRLTNQIEQLQGWVDRDTESVPVKKWAAKVIGYLEAQRKDALASEAEEGP